ncbi:polysaccharide biosynthesis tyrosine autokinase [Actinomadura flavalba]|uniref:polysaccharide biosynthesis tyrosine autokinase n=1 Tax=Actinomadura flavalba TaxID=1120938 RepID=UPI0003636B81|nr:CpsD/CapB family tyrosine-protein kinase [Actinomadura flavalba]
MSADQTAEPQGRFLALLRRYLVLLIVLAVAGGALGAAAGLLLPQPFKATATVLVSPLEGNPYSPQGRGDDLINLETEAQLVSTDTVRKIATQRAKQELPDDIEVSVPPNTQVLNLTCTAADSAAARAGAQSYADAYLEYRRQRAQAVVDGRLAKLKQQAIRVERELRQANRDLAASSGSQRAYLGQRITAYTNQLGVIDEQSNDIGSTPISPGQVITPAGAPSGPGQMRVLVYGAGGLFGGALFAFLILLLRERLNQRIRDAETIEGLGIRALSTVPADGPTEDTLALVSAPRSAAGEAYRRLRAAVVATAPQTPVALLVSSATPGGSSRLAASNLAVALAFAGAKTIMIDATTDDADTTGLFGARPGKGLSDTLLSGTDPATLLIHTDSQLRLLPRGARAREAAHRFSGPRMRETVKVLRRRSEYLIVNAPSLHDADAQALCTFADAVVLVVDQGVTTRQELRQAYVEAERAGATVLGALLEPRDQRRRNAAPRPAAARPRPPVQDEPADAEDEHYWPGPRGDEEPAEPSTLTTQALPKFQPDEEPAPAEPGDRPVASGARDGRLRVSDVKSGGAEPADDDGDSPAARTHEDVGALLEGPAEPSSDGDIVPRYGKHTSRAGRRGGS